MGSAEGRNAAQVGDGASVDAWAALVGLEPRADQVRVGVDIVVPVGVQPHERQHPVGALAVLQYARGWIEARIGLTNASSGEVLSRISAGRLERGPRRANCCSTIRPVVFSHSLTLGMPPACPRSRNGAQNEAPVNAASTCGQQLVDRVAVCRVLGADLAHQSLQRVAQVPLAQVQIGLREAGTDRVREAAIVVGGAPSRAPGTPQSRRDLLVNASRRQILGRPAP